MQKKLNCKKCNGWGVFAPTPALGLEERVCGECGGTGFEGETSGSVPIKLHPDLYQAILENDFKTICKFLCVYINESEREVLERGFIQGWKECDKTYKQRYEQPLPGR